ncbi:DUF6940 family protein [Sporocytophaga myxococcoides]|uniref:DUF6940 family protein n=1 Tax=Sporocytophaga myxococcoides TaxID=153721 RepID=UPI0004248216|nr:hypothetical protein [Sporocytophaga myxococcoides]
MWKYTEQKVGSEVTKYIVTQNEKIITYAETINLLCNSKEFRAFFIELLRSSSYDAYFWEVRPVTIDTYHEKFEFVLVNSPLLSKITADNSSFIQYFYQGKYVTSFFNLNRDAKLIVPIEIDNSNNYSHIANFVRYAPCDQVEIFWKKVGEDILNSIERKIKWVSTSGLGVHWLHVRIDTKPKYYSYLPYKNLE